MTTWAAFAHIPEATCICRELPTVQIDEYPAGKVKVTENRPGKLK